MHCTALHWYVCSSIYCTELPCPALHCSALHYTAMHCTAVHCRVLQCTAVHCSALHSQKGGKNKNKQFQKHINPLYVVPGQSVYNFTNCLDKGSTRFDIKFLFVSANLSRLTNFTICTLFILEYSITSVIKKNIKSNKSDFISKSSF